MGMRAYECVAEVRLPWDRCIPRALGAAGRWQTGRTLTRTVIRGAHTGQTALHLSIRVDGVRSLSVSGALILATAAVRDDLEANGLLEPGQEPAAVNIHAQEVAGAR